MVARNQNHAGSERMQGLSVESIWTLILESASFSNSMASQSQQAVKKGYDLSRAVGGPGTLELPMTVEIRRAVDAETGRIVSYEG